MIVSTSLVPGRFDAIAVWPFIFVRPTGAADAGLIEHELVHFREQAWRTPVWWAHYILSAAFRQAAEVRAYRRQVEVGGIGPATAAHYLASRYRLGISYGAALAALTS